MFSLLLKDLISDFLFDFTAAGVVPCGGRKTSPRTSTIVQFIFYFGPLRSAIIFWEIRNKQVAQRATIAHLSPMCQGQISFQKIQTHPSFNACSCYMKVSKGSNQKQQRKSGNTIFPIIRSIGVFLRRSRAANSVVGGPIWSKFELIHNIMHVLVTSKFEKDRININRDYVMTSIF